MDYRKESLKLHGQWKGKIEVNARAKVNDKDSLSLAYTPGVAEPCLAIITRAGSLQGAGIWWQ
jgi:malate dehydrogenase (oxaloacetate-decarboxylating)